ncbi:MAG TPA: L-threonylcarbamoyladenylate synthase [Acidimicrobiales bacterium]|nr:L-threonylcarbamoyladenylate synthase [Acidimicrobiales bacterium]
MVDRPLIMRREFESVRAHLLAGEVVAVPTDTVYGLCVALRVTGTTEPLFKKKQRPVSLAVPVMVADLPGALELCDDRSREALQRVGEKFWPGALTLVVYRGVRCSFDLGGDRSTIGLRVPDLACLRDLCRLVGPLGVTSANLHGGPPCTTTGELTKAFGSGLVILDGGRCAGAVSSVIDLTGATPVVLREGAVSLEMVLDALG